MDRHACVTEVDLRAYQLGELPDRLSTLVAEHLETCPACSAQADRFDAVVDPCILQLRQAIGQAVTHVPDAALSAVENRHLPDTIGDSAFPRAFGAYELLGELGRGGMSVVYLARQQRPSRTVALKMILSGAHAGIERRTRFLAEADAIGRLQHPHIVEIYEVGEQDGQLFLALEWLDAGSLAHQLAGKPQDPTASAALLEKLARAIHYAHECGIVHRDLKPSNILLKHALSAAPEAAAALHDVVPKIADFGLAKQEDVSLTATNAMLGTPAYMAPEQAAGDNRLVGPVSDVYALGAILYEMLTGRSPFQGSTVLETLEQVRSSEPTPPEHVQVKVHPDLSSICLKCLQKEPERRYGSALELAEDLRRFLEGTPTRARRVGSLERTWRWSRRNPTLAGTITTVALLLVVIAVGASLLSLNLHSALVTAENETVHAQNAERQATDHLWEAYLAQAKANRLSGRIGQRLQSLEAIRKAQRLPTPQGHSIDELRNEAIAALVLPDLEVAKIFAGDSDEMTGWEMAPDLDRFVVAHRDGDIHIHRVKDESVIAQLPNLGPILWQGVSFSPDGRYVQQRTRSAQVLWDVQGPTPLEKIRTVAAGHEHNVAFSADSKRVFFVADDGFILVYDTASGERLHRWHPGMRADRLACHPERDELAISEGGIVRVFDIATGARRLQINHDAFVYCMAWHPNGKVLATACDDHKIRMWDGLTGALARQPFTHGDQGMLFAFSHSGDYLAGSDWFGPLRVWDTRSGRQIFALSGSLAWFSRDDRKIALASDPRQVWRIHANPELVSLALPFPEASSRFNGRCNASMDSRFFVANTYDGWLLIDWATGREVAQIPMPSRQRVFAREGTQALLSHGHRGIWSWPVRAEADTNRVHIGPPELVTVHGNDYEHGASQDGRVIAIPRHAPGAFLFERDKGKRPLGPLEDARRCTVSPDGRWVATSNFNIHRTGISTTIWDAQTATVAKEFHLGGGALAGFSPDNHWLITRAHDKFQLWGVGDWKEGPDLHDDGGPFGDFAFAPDSKTLALSGPFSQIRLLETATGREFARLTVPEQTKLYPYLFSADGSHLVAVGIHSQLLYIWDLRAIRAGLKELDLDWDQPAYPPAAPVADRPIQVEFDLGEMKTPGK